MTDISRGASPTRDHRVDFYRGIALLMIFVNHVPGVMWEHVTTRNFGFSDSAELFVFLAGFASAFAYGRHFLKESGLIPSLKAFRRAGVLYLVHVTLTMIVVALFALAALGTGDGRYLQELGVGYFMTMPVDTLAGVATLGHQLAYVNILPVYCVILLLLPVMLLIVRRVGIPGLLAASAALWVACGVWRFNLPNHPNPGGWNFNPFAWQFVFALGLAAGLAKASGRQLVPPSRPLYAGALVYLALAYLFVEFSLWGWEHVVPVHYLVNEFDKTQVTLPRLLHLLALVYVFAYAPASSPLQRITRDNPLAALGRHSLPIFATGTVLSVLCQIVRLNRDTGPVLDTALIAAGIGLQFALAMFFDWWRVATAPAIKAAAAPVAERQRAPLREPAGRSPVRA